jgi:putative membrane protein insertion efficiency factor
MSALPGSALDRPEQSSTADPAHGPDQSAPRGPGKLIVALVHAYQLGRSGRPTGCRYVPTCSEYAVEAITVHGSVRGSAMAARRLLRCAPWGGHGFDPVPVGGSSCTHP